MKTVALVGLSFDKNLGDPLMVECVEYFYKKIAKQKGISLQFTYVDLFGRKSADEYSHVQIPGVGAKAKTFLLRGAGKVARSFSSEIEERIKNMRFQIDPNGHQRLKTYFTLQLQGADLVVIVGGALVKFRLIRDFHNPMHTLVEVANELGINVFFNAVGVENGYDESHPSCRIVKEYLNFNNVKMITTRDDIDTLRKYVNVDSSEKIIAKSADTAVWCDEVFGINPNYSSDTIGIGVIDPIRFTQYEQGITEEEYEDWICTIVKQLDMSGYKWKLFSNGHIPDYEFACKIAKNAGFGEDVVVPRPDTYEQLTKTINSFNMVIASRLHACIIAYGFDKPIVGIDWNDKVLFFGEATREAARFFKPKDKSPEEALEIIKSALGSTYDQEFRGDYRNTVVEYIERSFEFMK